MFYIFYFGELKINRLQVLQRNHLHLLLLELEKKLNHDVATDMEKHKEVLMQVLESDIIAAYYYQAGAIEAGLNYDKQLREAVRLLQNPEEYKKLLTQE